MKKRLYRMICLLFIVTIYSSLWLCTDIRKLLTLQTLQQHQTLLQATVSEHYLLAALAFIALYSIHGALALPATSLLIMTGGLLFGVVPGMLYSLLASIMGGCIAFFATRSLFGKALHSRYSTHLSAFKEQFHRNSTTYLLMMRIIPIIPFFLANVLSGLALVPPTTFLWTLIVGVLPSLLLYTMLGTELSSLSSTQDLLSWRMLSLYGIILSLTLIPLYLRKSKKIHSSSNP